MPRRRLLPIARAAGYPGVAPQSTGVAGRSGRSGVLRLLALLRDRRVPVFVLRRHAKQLSARGPRCRPSRGSARARTRRTAAPTSSPTTTAAGSSRAGAACATATRTTVPSCRPRSNNDINWCMGTSSRDVHLFDRGRFSELRRRPESCVQQSGASSAWTVCGGPACSVCVCACVTVGAHATPRDSEHFARCAACHLPDGSRECRACFRTHGRSRGAVLSRLGGGTRDTSRRLVVGGTSGTVEVAVAGIRYSGVMPPVVADLSDAEVAGLAERVSTMTLRQLGGTAVLGRGRRVRAQVRPAVRR